MIVDRGLFLAMLYEVSELFSKILSIVSSNILGNPKPGILTCLLNKFAGLWHRLKTMKRADPSFVHPVGSPSGKSNHIILDFDLDNI